MNKSPQSSIGPRLPRRQNGRVGRPNKPSLPIAEGLCASGVAAAMVLLVGWATPVLGQHPPTDASPPTEASPPSSAAPSGDDREPALPDAGLPTSEPTAEAAVEPPPETAEVALQLPPVAPADALTAARSFADAKLLAEEGYLAKALSAYETALELDGRDPYAHLEMAQFQVYMSQVSRGERRRNEHLDDAVGHAELARQLAPTNVDVLRQFAQIHLRLVEQNRVDSIPLATEAFEELLRLDDADDLQVLTSLGQLYLWQRDGVKAAEVLRRAADLRPNFPTVQLMLVEALLGSDQKAEAEKVLLTLIELLPSEAEHRLRLAELRSERGDHQGAVEVLRDPDFDIGDSPRIRQALARELHLSGDNAAALVLADSLLSEMSGEPGLHRLRVAIFSSLGRYREALDELRPLVDLESDDVVRRAQDLRLLSRLLERVGEPLPAADALQRLLAEPNLPRREQLRTKMGLIALWERHEMGDHAVDLLQREMQLASDAGERLEQVAFARLLSDLYQRLGKTAEAQQILDQVLADLPDGQEGERQTIALHRLPSLLVNGQYELAETTAASLLTSEDPEIRLAARLLRAQALANLDRLPEALESLEPADDADATARRRLLADRLELMFEFGEAERARAKLNSMVASETLDDYYFAAQVFQAQALYGEAIPYIEEVLEERPDSIQALFLYGAALERSGDRERSIATFQRLLDVSPNHAPSLNYLGYMWAEEGENLEQALQYIQLAVASEPDNGAYVDSLGWVLFKLERFAEARTHLEWAARLIPDDPTVFEHLGDLYVALDEVELARQAYRDAMALEGDHGKRVEGKLHALPENPS